MEDPELTLDEHERGELNAIVGLRGFAHFKRLAEAECARFDVELKNLDPRMENFHATLGYHHAKSKAAAQFWVGLMQRVSQEIAALEAGQRKTKPLKDLKPEDIQADPAIEELLS